MGAFSGLTVSSCVLPRDPAVRMCAPLLCCWQITGVNLGSRSTLAGPEPIVFVGELSRCLAVARVDLVG
jgi:hypothetical protein